MAITRLLVGVNNSLASMRAVAFVAHILGGRRVFRVCLTHTLASPPAGMMEFGGAEVPRKKNGSTLDCVRADTSGSLQRKERRQGHWNSLTRNCVGRDLHAAKSKIISYPSDTPREIIALARERSCHTIVVGAGPPPGFANSYNQPSR